MLLALALSVVEVLAPLPAHAGTPIRVNASGGANYTTVSGALAVAKTNGNDIIIEDSATYSGALAVPANTANPITIYGTNPSQPIISGAFSWSATTGSTLIVQNLIITNSGGNAITLAANCNLTCSNVTIMTAGVGQSIYSTATNVTLTMVGSYMKLLPATSSSIYLTGNSNWVTLIDSVFVNNTGDNITVNGAPSRLTCLNCTFYHYGDTSSQILFSSGGSTAYMCVTNCIFYQGQYALYRGGTPCTYSENYNLFFKQGANPPVSGASGVGANDKVCIAGGTSNDPCFFNTSVYDLHLTNNSAAINNGLTIASITNDYDNLLRPTGGSYEMGAYEYGVLLAYKTNYLVSSTNSVSCGAVWVDDTPASNKFTLTANQTVLAIYSPFNTNGATEGSNGREFGLTIDGAAEVAVARAAGNAANYPDGATTFWIGNLGMGTHIIKGRFRSPEIASGTITERVLLIYVFDGNAFNYVDSTTAVGPTSSGSFIDDTQAAFTFTPSAVCKALIMYNVKGTADNQPGKKIAINIGGTDFSQAQKAAGSASSYGENVFTLYCTNFAVSSSTVKGRFGSNTSAGFNATASARQLGVLLFAEAAVTNDYLESDATISTTANWPSNDVQATINRTTTDSRNLLVIAMGTKTNLNSSSAYGEAYGIQVNSTDVANSRASSAGAAYANCASTVWATNLAAATHTIKGTFGNNTGSETAKIDSRRIAALWFLPPGGGAPPAPNSPSASAATNALSTSFWANWTAIGGATNYLDVSTNSIVTNYVGVTTWSNVSIGVGTGTWQVTGLTTNTTYYYRLRAGNANGTSTNSAIISVTTLLAAPVVSAATSVSATNFTANWTGFANATNYLDVSTNNLFSDYVTGFQDFTIGTNTNSWVVSVAGGLTTNTTYYYRLRAGNPNGMSTNSAVTNLTTLLAAPVVSAATSVSATNFTANWTGFANATNYLDVSTNNLFSDYVTGFQDFTIGTNTNSWVVSVAGGLTTNTTYYYRLRAGNPNGVSTNSAIISVTTVLPAPSASAATNALSTSFYANWSAVGGATYYYLDVSTNSIVTNYVGGTTWSNVSIGVGTNTWLVNGLTTNTTYYYRLRTSNANGTSTNSAIITVASGPDAPAASAATNVLSTSFWANWAAAVGATGYYLDVSTNSGFVNFAGSYDNFSIGPGTNTWQATSLTTNTTYYYRLRAVNSGGGGSTNSAVISLLTLCAPVVTDDGGASNITATSAWLNANLTSTSDLPTTVRVYWDTSDHPGESTSAWANVYDFGELATGVYSNQATDLSPATVYYYRAWATNLGGEAWASVSSFSTLSQAPTVDNDGGASNVTATTAWLNANLTATGGASTTVRLYWDTTDKGISSTSDWTYVYNFGVKAAGVYSNQAASLSPGTLYYYRAWATNSAGDDWANSAASFTTPAIAPTIDNDGGASNVAGTTAWLNANLTSTGGAPTTIRLYWDTTDKGTSSTSDWTYVYNFGVKATGIYSNQATSLSPGTLYYYRAWATNSAGDDWANSAASFSTPAIAPAINNDGGASNVTAMTATLNGNLTSTGGAVTIVYVLWGTSNGGGAWGSWGNTNNLGTNGAGFVSKDVSGLTEMITYYYRFYATNSAGDVWASSSENFTTTSLIPLGVLFEVE